MDKQKIIANFIAPQMHMVITTVDSGNNPEAALVGFANRINVLTLR